MTDLNKEALSGLSGFVLTTGVMRLLSSVHFRLLAGLGVDLRTGSLKFLLDGHVSVHNFTS